MPDIVVYDVNNKEHMLLECKSPTDHLNLNQRIWLKRNIDSYKFNVGIVITSEKQIDKMKAEFSVL